MAKSKALLSGLFSDDSRSRHNSKPYRPNKLGIFFIKYRWYILIVAIVTFFLAIEMPAFGIIFLPAIIAAIGGFATKKSYYKKIDE